MAEQLSQSGNVSNGYHFLWNINFIAALYVLLFVFVPPLQVAGIYRVIAIICSVTFFGAAFVIAPNFISGLVLNYTLLSSSLIIALYVLSAIVYGGKQAIIINLQVMITIVTGYISMFYMTYNKRRFGLLVTVLLVVICFYCITTILGLEENPYA